MATVSSATSESIFQIKKWLGLNENPDGDISLKMGEASEMRNFRITADGHLQKRPGYKTVIDLESTVRGMWTGNVKGEQYTLAAAGGKVYVLDLNTQSAREIGEVAPDEKVFFFGFSGIVYILDGHEYRKWDGESYSVVTGYRPLVIVAAVPTGGGTILESVNKLSGQRRMWFSPDGTATDFVLPEKNIASVDYVKNLVTGADMTGYTADLAAGTVKFTEAPAAGTSSIEVGWTVTETARAEVTAMRYAETYNGTQDNRVFMYGDGSNKAIYSGLDYNGLASAEYFPDLSVINVGDENTPVTALIRQYSRLLAFKSDATYSIAYSSLTLADGTVTAGFYATPVNRNIGNEAMGQAQLITNYARSLHGGGVYEWKNGNYGLTSDERQAQRISKRIENTLRSFDFTKCVTFDNEYKQDYYIVCGDTAVIHNYSVDAWFVYTDFPAACFTMLGATLYIGTNDGKICEVSREYMSDDGRAIDAFWCSGSMDFKKEWQKKSSSTLFVVIKPESAARVQVTARSDMKANYITKVVAASLATLSKVNFARWSFNTNRRSQVERLKIKVKKFALYQLVFSSNATDERSTIESVDIRLRYAGYVK